MNLDLLYKTPKCTTCTKLGENLKSIIPFTKFSPIKTSSEPNQESQIDIGGPIFIERDQKMHFLAYLDCFSKLRLSEVCEHGNSKSTQKYLENYFLLDGVQRVNRYDQARCQIGDQISNFFEKQNVKRLI